MNGAPPSPVSKPGFTSPRPAPPVPRVSVVVAAYNAANTLPECLESLLRLNHPDYEIIVVDDGSYDETPRVTAKFPTVRTLRLKTNEGLSQARNLGSTGPPPARSSPSLMRTVGSTPIGCAFWSQACSTPRSPELVAPIFCRPRIRRWRRSS